jgi:aminopeptidase N
MKLDSQSFEFHVQVRIYARPEMIGNLAYAALLAPKFQAWLEQETGIPYNLPKMGKLEMLDIQAY